MRKFKPVKIINSGISQDRTMLDVKEIENNARN